jgi:hypothetical protein
MAGFMYKIFAVGSVSFISSEYRNKEDVIENLAQIVVSAFLDCFTVSNLKIS